METLSVVDGRVGLARAAERSRRLRALAIHLVYGAAMMTGACLLVAVPVHSRVAVLGGMLAWTAVTTIAHLMNRD